MWFYKNMQNIGWVDSVTNKNVLEKRWKKI